MQKNILIIGAGIHGCFIAKYLLQKKFNIYIIEKERDICLGSSSATHNRANRGFHYPRSQETVLECFKAYSYFEKNYNRFLKKIQSYYCIEKKSKVSFLKYVNFFKKNNLKFKIIKNSKHLNNKELQGIIKAEEGCYDHFKIKKYLKKQLNNKKINFFFNFELKKFKKIKSELILVSEKEKKIKLKVDIIINATYDNTNNIIKIFKKNFQDIKYNHQLTEVAVVESKNHIPGVTIMDGPFATIMPLVGEKKKYLVYDVENSILKKSNKPIKKSNKKSNFLKMYSKLKKYLNNGHSLKYLYSNYGNRPIPAKDIGANRSTKILKIKHNGFELINILEGKYISAPYIAKKLSNEIK